MFKIFPEKSVLKKGDLATSEGWYDVFLKLPPRDGAQLGVFMSGGGECVRKLKMQSASYWFRFSVWLPLPLLGGLSRVFPAGARLFRGVRQGRRALWAAKSPVLSTLSMHLLFDEKPLVFSRFPVTVCSLLLARPPRNCAPFPPYRAVFNLTAARPTPVSWLEISRGQNYYGSMAVTHFNVAPPIFDVGQKSYAV